MKYIILVVLVFLHSSSSARDFSLRIHANVVQTADRIVLRSLFRDDKVLEGDELIDFKKFMRNHLVDSWDGSTVNRGAAIAEYRMMIEAEYDGEFVPILEFSVLREYFKSGLDSYADFVAYVRDTLRIGPPPVFGPKTSGLE